MGRGTTNQTVLAAASVPEPTKADLLALKQQYYDALKVHFLNQIKALPTLPGPLHREYITKLVNQERFDAVHYQLDLAQRFYAMTEQERKELLSELGTGSVNWYEEKRP